MLRNFDSTALSSPPKGRFLTHVKHNESKICAEFHVLPSPCKPVIGQELISALGLQIDGATMTVREVRAVKSDYNQMLKDFPRLLSDDMGTYPDYAHKIEIQEDAIPSTKRLRPVPLAKREKVASAVLELDRLGIWEPVDKSSWVHAMVTVNKPDGDIRVTTDLSPLNTFVIPDRFPLPNPKDLFLELRGARFFTKLDLRKAFFHIELDPESRALTTTLTHQGLRQYTRLPMGLKDSVSVCQRLVSQTLAGCVGCIAYIDDILVFGSTVAEHDNNLRAVLEKLNEKDFRLQISKCQFCRTEVKFLGHIISSDGISPDPENLKAIVDAPTPKTVKQVQSFLGLVNYYNEFIRNLSSKVEPLRRLTRKGVKFQWSKTCENAFVQLKKELSGEVKNFIFDPNAPTFVTSDACDVGLGATLSQLQNGREVPIAFASHTLQPRERSYAVNEKEALACVWACETWEKFLLGRHFTLRTDHTALVSLLKSTSDTRKSSKFARWIERLSAFDYTVEYKRGSDNIVADALSRMSLQTTVPAICEPGIEHVIGNLTSDNLTLDGVKTATTKDALLNKVQRFVTNGWPQKRDVSNDVRPFFILREELSYQDGVLLRDERIVLPTSLRRKLLHTAHAGHPGIVRMKRKLRETYWWPGQDRDIEAFVKHCHGCQLSDKSLSPSNVPQSTIPKPKQPWSRLAIDIAGPFLIAPESSKYIVVLIDYHSRFPEVLMTPTVTSAKLIVWLEEVFSRFGAPLELFSDNGPQFCGREFTEFLERYNVRHVRTAVYNPQENGCVERFNRYLKHGIEAFHATGESWTSGINALLRNYRSTSPTPGGKSPAEILLNRRSRLPFEIPLVKVATQSRDTSPQPPQQQQQSSKVTCRGPYRVGDIVLARRPQVLKGQSHWSQPLRVLEVLGNWTYRLSDNQRWNARKLRRYVQEEHQWLEDNSHDIPPQSASVGPRRSSRATKGVPPLRYPQN